MSGKSGGYFMGDKNIFEANEVEPCVTSFPIFCPTSSALEQRNIVDASLPLPFLCSSCRSFLSYPNGDVVSRNRVQQIDGAIESTQLKSRSCTIPDDYLRSNMETEGFK
ncbi:hypothetical protein EGR_11088 [Echinococcus granulosus]|uniref:Uncharacterized protein n=1 Tax=Echinococcus granulosus TaxID=6210 RepID=W6UKN4_ECHGR|nr:hypothetical protein EGR_11088 [Echinococcus granulosus]EUB54054.1 hypothetical protein EGR_11088 [Echinococcus granulosus]